MEPVKIQKESKQTRRTYSLKRPVVKTCQIQNLRKLVRGTHKLVRAAVRIGKDMEGTKASERHLHTREGQGRDWSEHTRKVSQLGHLPTGEGRC